MSTQETCSLELKILNTYSDHENLSFGSSKVAHTTVEKPSKLERSGTVIQDFTEPEVERSESVSIDERITNEKHEIQLTENQDEWNISTDSSLASLSFGSDGERNEAPNLLYDIDLQTSGFDLVNHEDCPEAELLTPTLSADCLQNWQLLPDLSPDSRDSGIDTYCCSYDTGVPFTLIKSRKSEGKYSTSRKKNIKPNTEETLVEVEVVSSGDDLDEPEELPCVSYSAVHMETGVAGETTPEIYTPVETSEAQTAQTEEEPSQGTKRKKDKKEEPVPVVLKRPKNGFIRYAMKYRKKVAEDHPRLDNREISRILGIRWRKLSYEEKKTYELEFQTEMNKRKQEHPEWRYGGVRQYVDPSACEPIPSRLRPRHTLKLRKIPKMTRSYNRRGKKAVVQLTWVQCDRCDKWRQLPYGISPKNMPETWYCEYNWPPKNYCEADEDQDDPEEMEFTKNYFNELKAQEQAYQYNLEDYVTF